MSSLTDEQIDALVPEYFGVERFHFGPSRYREFARAILAASPATPQPDPYGFDVLLGDRMYIDSSMQYRNGTVNLTIKRKPRDHAVTPEGES